MVPPGSLHPGLGLGQQQVSPLKKIIMNHKNIPRNDGAMVECVALVLGSSRTAGFFLSVCLGAPV